MSNRIYQNSKMDIIQAAKSILLEEGLGKLTTENIITKSGISKGGFFYHFKTKNDLIHSLMERIIEEMDETIQEFIDADKNKKGVTLRAYINYTLSPKSDEMMALCRSMTEVMFDKDADSGSYLKFYEKLSKKVLTEGVDKHSVMTILYAIDGYWYNEMFGIRFFSKKDNKEFFQHLIQLTL